METKKCKYCMEEIPKKAKRCPKCGGKFGMPTIVKVLLGIIIFIIIIVALVSSCTAGVVNSVDDAIKETNKEYEDVNGKTSFKVGESFENKLLKVTLDSTNTNYTNISQYATVKTGYKIVEYTFTFTNVGDEDELASLYDFNCYADNEAMDKFYLIDDDGYSLLSSTISANKIAKGSIYCEVPTGASKISVEYDANWFTEGSNYEFIAQ